jgi:hypothetical protein
VLQSRKYSNEQKNAQYQRTHTRTRAHCNFVSLFLSKCSLRHQMLMIFFLARSCCAMCVGTITKMVYWRLHHVNNLSRKQLNKTNLKKLSAQFACVALSAQHSPGDGMCQRPRGAHFWLQNSPGGPLSLGPLGMYHTPCLFCTPLSLLRQFFS